MKTMNVIKLSVLLMLIVSLTGCGNNEAAYKESIHELEVKIKQLEDEKESLEAIAKISDNAQAENNNKEKKSDVETTGEAKTDNNEIQLGDTITIEDVLEFSLSSCEWADKVIPSNTDSTYTYYDGAEGETYLIIRGTLKNLSGNAFSIRDNQEIKLIVNGKYNFDASMVCEGPDGDDLDYDTKPLQTLNLIMYASISDEVKEQFENGLFTINMVADPEYLSNLFDIGDSPNTYYINIANSDIF